VLIRLSIDPALTMPKKKTDLQRAAGKLISAIQKEWGTETGEPNVDFSERVMDSAHDLLQADGPHAIKELLGARTVRQYLGDVWVQRHPSVMSAVVAFEEALEKEL
jgi:hypothetical protein